MRALRTTLLLLAAAALVSPALAQTSGSPELPADVVAVSTEIFLPTGNPGGSNEGTCTIENLTSGDVRVRIRAEVEYADGAVSPLTGNFDPGVLGPGGGFSFFILFLIPEDAALGTATFRCAVRAQSVDEHGRPEVEVSESTFEIVAP